MSKKKEHAIDLETKTEVLPTMIHEGEAMTSPAQAVALQQSGGALAMRGASPELLEMISEVQENLSTVENFKIARIRMSAHGAELVEGEEPLMVIEGVILHAKKTNVFYDKPYNPVAKPEAPTCFSIDGVMPVADLKNQDGSPRKPQNATCKGCPKAEWKTNAMGSGKACRNMKPIFLLLGDSAIIPRQLSIPPTALKAADSYLMNLTERGLNYRKVVTQIEFYKEDPKSPYCKMRFKMLRMVDSVRGADVEYLRKFWLPVMSEQTIEQSEFTVETAPQASGPVDTKGEY